MRNFIAVCFFSFCFSTVLFAQKATIKGTVKDGNTGELLSSATVLQPPTNGTVTDIGGSYALQVEPGDVTLVVSYLGLNTDTLHLTLKPGQNKNLDIKLGGSGTELGMVVVTENRLGEKVQKITQSLDIMKPRMLEANNITNMQAAVQKLPGVTILDGQMSVRGGSGYAYGAGSRVTLVVDEMPLMTADRQDIKWAFIPVENAEQVELLKGAASLQYGASALNGVLNVTTAYARDTPNTRITVFYEGVGKPPVDSFQWWKRKGHFFDAPNKAGFSFLHSQKFGDVDFVIGGMLQGYQSHLASEYDDFTRFNGKLRWHPHKFQRLTLELAASVLYDKFSYQFYWQDMGHPYLSASGVTIFERFFYAYIDPKIRFIDKGNNEHKLYARIYRQNNLDGETDFWINSIYYQFRHDFGKYVKLLAGVNNDHYTMHDGTLGSHKGDFGGGFLSAQLNYKFFTLNVGVREEYVHEDSAITPTKPVFRAGVNFEIRRHNYIRASFGQAFRLPSIAEKYVDYQLGSLLIQPNLDIKPESGFTMELGYKRNLKIGNWLGYFDASAFWYEFKNMLEFTFHIKSLPNPPYLQPFFRSENVANARIFGWEFSVYGEGKLAPNVDMTVLLGYTYFYGVNLNDTTGPDNRNIGTFFKNTFTHYILPTAKSNHDWDSITAGMLKYRQPHLFKADIDLALFKKYHIGTSLQYYSYMTKIDAVFTLFIPGVDQYRKERRNKGDVVWDLRAGYDINQNVSLNFLVKNVLNSDYAIRVARPDAPRTFCAQMVVNLGALNKHRNHNLGAGSLSNM